MVESSNPASEQSLRPEDVEARLRAEVNWQAPELLSLLHLLHEHSELDIEGEWSSVEMSLFGDPAKFLNKEGEILASLMNGPSVDPVRFAGLELSDRSHDKLWNKRNWKDLILEADGDLIEVGDFDEYPGTSDVFYEISTPGAVPFARALRIAIVQAIQKGSRRRL